MKKAVFVLAVICAIGGTTFGQSKPGEGWYDSGTGQANAPGSSKYNNEGKNGPNNGAHDGQDRQQTVQVEVLSESGNYDTAIQTAKDTLISMGAKAIVVAGVTRIIGQGPGYVFKIVLGVCFPATTVADGERNGPQRSSSPTYSAPRDKTVGHAKDEAPGRH